MTFLEEHYKTESEKLRERNSRLSFTVGWMRGKLRALGLTEEEVEEEEAQAIEYWERL